MNKQEIKSLNKKQKSILKTIKDNIYAKVLIEFENLEINNNDLKKKLSIHDLLIKIYGKGVHYSKKDTDLLRKVIQKVSREKGLIGGYEGSEYFWFHPTKKEEIQVYNNRRLLIIAGGIKSLLEKNYINCPKVGIDYKKQVNFLSNDFNKKITAALLKDNSKVPNMSAELFKIEDKTESKITFEQYNKHKTET